MKLNRVNGIYDFKNYDYFSYDVNYNLYKIEDADFFFSDEFTKNTRPDLYEKNLRIREFKNNILNWKYNDLFISFN